MSRIRKPYRTEHQKELMGMILAGANAGAFLTLNDVFLRHSYGVSYGAVRKSVKLLEEAGFLVKQRAGRAIHLVPTQRGYDWFRPRT